MRPLLVVCGWIDAISRNVGKAVSWLVLVAVLVSAINASVRYLFDASSNAWLELQWYLFAAVFLLCASYTHLRNEHIRIDILNNMLPRRVQTIIDIVGGLLFLLPMTVLIGWLSIDMVADSFMRDEQSSNAGGLLRWPVKVLMPIGFLLLSLQGLSEVVKRIAFMLGQGPDPAELAKPLGSHPPDVVVAAPGEEPLHG